MRILSSEVDLMNWTANCLHLREHQNFNQQKTFNQRRVLPQDANHQTVEIKRYGVMLLIVVWQMSNETAKKHVIFVEPFDVNFFLPINPNLKLSFFVKWLWQIISLHFTENILRCDYDFNLILILNWFFLT